MSSVCKIILYDVSLRYHFDQAHEKTCYMLTIQQRKSKKSYMNMLKYIVLLFDVIIWYSLFIRQQIYICVKSIFLLLL